MYLGAFATVGNLSSPSSSVSVRIALDFPLSLDFTSCLDFAGCLDCTGCLDVAGCFDLDLVTRLVRVETFDFGETLNVEDLDLGETLNLRFFGLVRPESLALELPDMARLLLATTRRGT